MRTTRRFRGACAAFLLSLPVACGGSSGSADGNNSAPPTALGTAVFMDRSAGTADVATAVVSGVVLEDMAGGMTENLLSSPTEFFMTNEDTRMTGLSLREAPRATYRAMHIAFVPGSHTVRWKAGGWDPIQAPSVIKAAFAEPVMIAAGDWIQLRHAGVVSFAKDQKGEVHWTPKLVPEHRTGSLISGAVVKVVRIDAQALVAWGEFAGMPAFIARMRFSDNAIMVRDGTDVPSAKEFVDGLRIGTRLVVDGMLAGRRQLEVVFAEDLSWPDPPSSNQGVKTKVLASIDRISTQQGVMTLHVLQVLRHGRGPLPPRTLVAEAGHAKIKWNPHANHTPKHVPFSALESGMVIEAEWKTPASYGTAIVTKIRIKQDA